MKSVWLGPWKIEVDQGRTREACEVVAHGAAADCGCPGCSNYLAAREANLPVEFRSFLDSLGIDWEKEVSARRVAPLDAGHSLYAGSFAVVGEIVEGPKDANMDGWRLDVFEEMGEGCHVAARVWQNPPEPWPRGETVRLRFLVTLPWIGEDPEAPIDIGGCKGPIDRAGGRS